MIADCNGEELLVLLTEVQAMTFQLSFDKKGGDFLFHIRLQKLAAKNIEPTIHNGNEPINTAIFLFLLSTFCARLEIQKAQRMLS